MLELSSVPQPPSALGSAVAYSCGSIEFSFADLSVASRMPLLQARGLVSAA
jgi:hypothetical protein